jgi:hybrid cluster-associated redox disulfide protein
MELNLHMTVKEILQRHPGAVRFFLKRGMLCAGCPTEAFHTLAEAARSYGQAPEELLAALRTAIESG